MSNIEEQIQKVLEDCVAAIRENMEREGINATGRTSLSFRVKKEAGKMMLVGGGSSSKFGGDAAPVESVEIGRAPGGDWKQLRPIIVRWTVAKNMQIVGANEKEIESHRWAISTVIAKNIVAQGTKRYTKHVDVYSTPVKRAAAAIRQIVGLNTENVLHAAIVGASVETNTNL